MNPGLDAAHTQRLAEPVALSCLDDELVVHGLTRVGNGNRGHVDITEKRAVGASNLAAPLVPAVQPAELDPQDGALQPIHPAVPADEGMLVLADPPMIPHLANARRDFGIRRDDGPGIPAGPQVLTGIEAETSGIGGRPGHFPVAGRALCLGGVFDHRDAVAPGDRHHGAHVDAAAVEVYRDDGPGPGRDRGLHSGYVHQQRLWIDVDEAWDRAAPDDRLGRGGEGVRDRDHLVAFTHVNRPQRQLERVGAVGAGHRLPHSAIRGELSFEAAHFLALDEVRGGEDTIDRRVDLRAKLLVLGPQVSQRYGRSRPRRLRVARQHRRVLLHLVVR